jgi:hypothetical protein
VNCPRPTKFWLFVTAPDADNRIYECAAQTEPAATEAAREAGRRLKVGGRVALYDHDPTQAPPPDSRPESLRTFGRTVHGFLVDIS